MRIKTKKYIYQVTYLVNTKVITKTIWSLRRKSLIKTSNSNIFHKSIQIKLSVNSPLLIARLIRISSLRPLI